LRVLTEVCGTPGYMAPEIFKKTGHSKPVDIWAIGVISYFLLCGYTPFDRDSNIEEMQAILVADYSFTPVEYWRGVSQAARDFIKRCLTIDMNERMTAHEALSHHWLNPDKASTDGIAGGAGEDLLPVVKKNFNARRTLHAAIDTIRAINKLREGGGMMNGAKSKDPQRDNGAKTDPDAGTQTNVNAKTNGEEEDKVVGQGGDRMEIDSRGHGRGQTEAQIQAQQRKVMETSHGLWQSRAAGGGAAS